jgi:integrase
MRARIAGRDPLRYRPRIPQDALVTRTVQEWLGHESLATTQKYLEPWKETEKQLEAMKLPF